MHNISDLFFILE